MPADASSLNHVMAALRLEPHPTCGYVAETYRSSQRIAAGGLDAPFRDGRPIGTALYFLVTPERQVRWHRIRNDQLYHRYLGDALEVLSLYTDGSQAIQVLGDDITAGEHLQLFIPGNTFHAARLRSGGRWFLGASTEWPGVEPEDVELGELTDLQRRFPAAASPIADFAA
ncbi:MAG: cupin domain-containing protein [Candidatus Dormibacteria bacterium]